MNKKLAKLLFICSLLISTIVLAVESPSNSSDSKDQKLNIFEMRKKLEEQTKHVAYLAKEISQVELNLGIQNKKYLKLSDNRMKLEEALSVSKKNTDFDNLNLKKNYNETKSVLMGILLNHLEKTETPADMLTKKILISNLQTRLVELDGLIRSNSEIQGSVAGLYSRLDESLKTEKELVSIMNELEQKKKDLRQAILNESAKKEDYSRNFDELKNKVAIEKDSAKRKIKKAELEAVQITEEVKIPSANEAIMPIAGGGYRSPLYLHQGIEYNQKGVTFKFIGKNELLATKGGKIAYTGSLSNYGNVVMIDHGNDTRTVLLGQFDVNVKNGDLVKESQIIGYTNPKSVNGIGDGKIYFEVRKNNLAQNTYLLLDKKSLARNTSK